MKILLVNNDTFGGYNARLVNDNLTTWEMPIPINLEHRGYCSNDKEYIIDLCRKDASKFNIKNLEVIDQTEE